jgi:hypothetical protein
MKRLSLVLIYTLLGYCVFAQVSLKDITGLLELNPNKLESHLQKKGFKRSFLPDNNAIGYSQSKFDKKDSIEIYRNFEILNHADNPGLLYSTSSKEEWLSFMNEMRMGGFHFIEPGDTCKTMLYQKEEWLMSCTRKMIDTTWMYSIQANKKMIPDARNIGYAEDLLTLNAHEYLVAAFGKSNVKTDSFMFSQTMTSKCSVIFPNTSHQAIFIWKDQDNLRDISFIIIGEQMHNESNKNVNTVMLSRWRSSQGLYCGMSLKEVQNLNKQPFSFYNWRTESAGFLAPSNKGEINFSRIMPVFNCMNCSFLYVDQSRDIIGSDYSLGENQKVYVASYVVLPEKEEADKTWQTSMK